MLCGNDPTARGRLTPGDVQMVEWFREYLRWCSLPDDERAQVPEPQPPETERR